MLNVTFLTQYLGQISFKFWFQTLSGIKNGFLQLTPVAELFVSHHKETQVNATVTIITHCYSYSSMIKVHTNVQLIPPYPSQFM